MIINITDQNRETQFGDPCYNDEYLLFLFEVETVNTSVLCKDYNTYIDGELVWKKMQIVNGANIVQNTKETQICGIVTNTGLKLRLKQCVTILNQKKKRGKYEEWIWCCK